jgi:hypothetical protein
MDEDGRMEILRRMLEQQHALRTVVEAASIQAELAKAANADSLALAIFMLMECLQTYSKELSKFVTNYIGEDE